MKGLVLAALLGLVVAPAAADSPMRTTRSAFLADIRAEIDAADIIAPIADPTCRKASTLRSCSARINPAITMDLTDAADFFDGDPDAKRRPAIEAFLAGGEGKLYEARFTLKDTSDRVLANQFDALCISAARVLQKVSRDKAARNYRTAIRRSANALGTAEVGKTAVKARSVKLTVEMEKGAQNVVCRLNSSDVDH